MTKKGFKMQRERPYVELTPEEFHLRLANKKMFQQIDLQVDLYLRDTGDITNADWFDDGVGGCELPSKSVLLEQLRASPHIPTHLERRLELCKKS